MNQSVTSMPALEKLAGDWSWLFDHSGFRLLAISPFGDLLLADRADAIYLLDINLGSLISAEAEGSPAQLFPESFDDRIASSYRKAQLFLKPGTCYGYKRQTVVGGSFHPENVYIATLVEYVSFMGSFHNQIKDVADGESVVTKVVRGHIN